MTQLNKSDYVVKIANATPLELLIITYELFLNSVSDCVLKIETEEFPETVEHTRTILNELVCSLNFNYPLSKQLFEIYIYVNKLLLSLIYKRQKAILKTQNQQEKLNTLAEIKKIISHLHEGFVEINDLEQRDMSKQKTSVYSGLTYGKNGVLNDYFPENTNNDYKA